MDCLGVRMVRKPTGGLPAILGATILGWSLAHLVRLLLPNYEVIAVILWPTLSAVIFLVYLLIRKKSRMGEVARAVLGRTAVGLGIATCISRILEDASPVTPGWRLGLIYCPAFLLLVVSYLPDGSNQT